MNIPAQKWALICQRQDIYTKLDEKKYPMKCNVLSSFNVVQIDQQIYCMSNGSRAGEPDLLGRYTPCVDCRESQQWVPLYQGLDGLWFLHRVVHVLCELHEMKYYLDHEPGLQEKRALMDDQAPPAAW